MPCASEMRWFTTALFQRPSLPVQAGRAAATGWASAPEAAVFSLKGIEGVFVAIGSIIAAIVCAVIAGVKGRGQDSTVMLTASANGIAATAVSATRTAISSKGSSAAKRSRNPSIASVVSYQPGQRFQKIKTHDPSTR